MIQPHHPEEVRRLADICFVIFDADVFERCRQRKFVDARIVFSKLMHERGVGCSDIGHILGRNHATILHYFWRGEALLETDNRFRKKYVTAREEYIGEDPVYYYSSPELRKKYLEMRSELEAARDKLAELTNQNKYDKRIKDILDVVRYRTKHGKEKETLNRINRMYNGL